MSDLDFFFKWLCYWPVQHICVIECAWVGGYIYIYICFIMPLRNILFWGCLLGGVFVPCFHRMPGGVIAGDSGLSSCVPVQFVTSIVRAELLPFVCWFQSHWSHRVAQSWFLTDIHGTCDSVNFEEDGDCPVFLPSLFLVTWLFSGSHWGRFSFVKLSMIISIILNWSKPCSCLSYNRWLSVSHRLAKVLISSASPRWGWWMPRNRAMV